MRASYYLLLGFAAAACGTGPDRIVSPGTMAPSVSAEDFPTGETTDRNGNGQVCRKLPPDGPKKFPNFVVDDSGDESSPCPPGFELVAVGG